MSPDNYVEEFVILQNWLAKGWDVFLYTLVDDCFFEMLGHDTCGKINQVRILNLCELYYALLFELVISCYRSLYLAY